MSIRYLQAEGRILKLTHLEKIFFPEADFRKKDLILYYKKIAPVVLPHLRDRPFTLKRYPQGVEGESFYEKNCPHHRPSWIKTALFGGVRYCLINDLPSLLWTAGLAAIELHTTLARVKDLQRPDFVVFDLDPGEGADIRDCIEAALLLRQELGKLGFRSCPKTSGGKGLHIYVPLNTACRYEQTKTFARAIARRLEGTYPDRIVSRMLKKYRRGKVFIDWSQNTDFKTTRTVYSLHAGETPTVSTPVSWKEIQDASSRDSRARKLLSFEAGEVLSRVARLGDLFAPALTLRQSLKLKRFGDDRRNRRSRIRLVSRSRRQGSDAPGTSWVRAPSRS